MEDPLETFTLLPLQYNQTTNTITHPSPPPPTNLINELTALNTLHKALSTLETPIPGPPLPVHPKRSTQITKLRESGNDSFRKGDLNAAIRIYTVGLQMALGRPGWEACGLVRDEAAGLYANRAQAWMGLGDWVEGSVDAECSVECKRVGNAKGWWRRGKCLMEMGEGEEAREWVLRGVELEGRDGDLGTLLGEIESRFGKV